MAEGQAENKKGIGPGGGWFYVILFLGSLLVTAVCCLIKDCGREVMLRDLVVAGAGSFAALYVHALVKRDGGFDYDNGEHEMRFLLLYLICLLFAAACAFLPPAGWPFLAVFVVLSLFSSGFTGFFFGAYLLVLSGVLSECGIPVFAMYLVCGAVGVAVFKNLDEAYRIAVPIVISLLFLFSGEAACIVLFAEGALEYTLFLIPIANVVVSYFLLLLALKFFSARVIFKYREKYMEINDPECALLVELKEMSRDEYYHAVHTAYFCDRIGRRLSLDADALKAAGYYHRIGVLKGENSWENVRESLEQHDFPPAAREVIREYLDRSGPMRKKETLVLIMADAMVSSVRFLFARNPGSELDYNQITDMVFSKKLELPGLAENEISLREISRMKRIFKEEKLYYDFLR